MLPFEKSEYLARIEKTRQSMHSAISCFRSRKKN